MYDLYHSLMTTLKSPYLVFCCNKFFINPDFAVRLQVTILKRSQTANDSVRYSGVRLCHGTSIIIRILCAVCVMSTGFVLCAVIFLSQCHCHSVQALF